MIIISGNSNKSFAEKTAKHVKKKLAKCDVTHFDDGEIRVRIRDSIRSKDVFIIQSTCAPANRNIMELLIMIDAAKRASAGRVTAVIPYFGYARQDRKDKPRVAITAKLVANLITTAGADRVLSMDLHAGQIQGFFDIPVDNLYGAPQLADIIKKQTKGEIVVVSPDAGGVQRAREFAKLFKSPLAIIDKRRPKPNVSEVMNIIGEVKGKIAVLVDDMIDTAGTITKSADALTARGAKKVYAVCTHPVFSGDALEKIEKSSLTKVAVTDTIPLKRKSEKIDVVSSSKLFADAIYYIHHGKSLSGLFI